MRVEAEDFFAQFVVEPAHDADDDDEHRDAQRDAEDGNERDDGNESPFGPQITQRQEQFKRQSRHVHLRLKAIAPAVNEVALCPTRNLNPDFDRKSWCHRPIKSLAGRLVIFMRCGYDLKQ